MRRTWNTMWTVALIVSGVALGVATTPTDAQQQKNLVATKVASAPATDGTLDATWTRAPLTTVKVMGGKNLPGGTTDVAMRAVYTTDRLYVLLQYKDATESFRRSPWQKQTDGSWKKLEDPNDKGGDNNLYYEDKVAVVWNINTPSFEQKGCMTACHTGEGKPFGNKYTPNAGERLDMWHAKFVRGAASIAQIDDQYVDHTRFDAVTAPDAGRKGDPKTGGGYVDNVADDKKGPKFALKGNKPSPPYWIVDGEKEAFDDSKYKAGDEVPGIVVAPFAGDRGDISGTAVWKDGAWTLVMTRKLVTGSQFDVQFDDMKKAYAFGVAVFDNAQVRHAFSPGVLKLVFE